MEQFNEDKVLMNVDADGDIQAWDARKLEAYINGQEIVGFGATDENMFESIEDSRAVELGFKQVIQVNLSIISSATKQLDVAINKKEHFKLEIHDTNTGLHIVSKHALCLLAPEFTYGRLFPERIYRILCPDLEFAYDAH